MILPGSTLGILGGGQLGRMFTTAAQRLSYRVIVLEPDPLSPAGIIADEHLQSDYHDKKALSYLGKSCDVISTEFENIPASSLELLAQNCRVRPSAFAIQYTQNRIKEKHFIQSLGLKTVPFAKINHCSDIRKIREKISFPAVLKTAQFGYDGKGQILIQKVDKLEKAFKKLKQTPCILEQYIDLNKEISVILARKQTGEIECYPIAENEHRQGILHKSIVPARISEQLQQEALEAANRLASALEFVGVMAVEFFIDQSGQLLVNEIAPRTHNSGHYSLDACLTSQFEQQVRAICDLPLSKVPLRSPIVMVNLLGDLWGKTQPDWDQLFADPKVTLHLYGKKTARARRKMGHFCYLSQSLNEAIKESDLLWSRL